MRNGEAETSSSTQAELDALGKRVAELSRENERLRQRLADRVIVARAKGVVMQIRRCSEDEAYRWMQRISQDRNIPLREIATEILAARPGQPVA